MRGFSYQTDNFINECGTLRPWIKECLKLDFLPAVKYGILDDIQKLGVSPHF